MKYQLHEVSTIAQKLFLEYPKVKIFLFTGDLGAGKTTLIKAMCRELGVSDEVSSPTFSIVNEYKRNTGESVFHIDLYRLNDEDEALNIGLEEYFDKDTYFFIEWYQVVEHWFGEEALRIHIENNESSSRKIVCL